MTGQTVRGYRSFWNCTVLTHVQVHCDWYHLDLSQNRISDTTVVSMCGTAFLGPSSCPEPLRNHDIKQQRLNEFEQK